MNKSDDFNIKIENATLRFNVADEENLYATLTGYEGEKPCGDLVIPEEVTYEGKKLKVTTIGSEAFCDCNSLTSITIPNNITTIEERAFECCEGLRSVTIPNNVATIEGQAFSDCSGVTSIIIGSGVTSINSTAFSTDDVTSIIVDKDNKVYDSRNKCNAIIETETGELVLGCRNTVIPDDITIIGDEAFRGVKGLNSITIPASVTKMGDAAFDSCYDLTKVYLNGSVPPKIDDSVFCGTPYRRGVELGLTVYIPERTFEKYLASPWKYYRLKEYKVNE